MGKNQIKVRLSPALAPHKKVTIDGENLYIYVFHFQDSPAVLVSTKPLRLEDLTVVMQPKEE